MHRALDGTRLFIGDLASHCDENHIQELFRENSINVLNVRLMRGKNSLTSLNYGFVQLTKKEDAARAIAEFDSMLFLGRRIRVKYATPSMGPNAPKTAKPTYTPSANSIFVKFQALEMGINITEETLRYVFSSFGEITDVSIKASNLHGAPDQLDTGYGFVHFTDNDEGIATSFRAMNAIAAMTVIDGVEYSCEASQNLLRSIHELKKRQLANQHQPYNAQFAGTEPMMQSKSMPHYSSRAPYNQPGNRGNPYQHETPGHRGYIPGQGNYQIKQMTVSEQHSHGNRERGRNCRSYSSMPQNIMEHEGLRYSNEFEPTNRSGQIPVLPFGERTLEQYPHSPRSQADEHRNYQSSPRADMSHHHSVSRLRSSSNFSLVSSKSSVSFPGEVRVGNVAEVGAAGDNSAYLSKGFGSHRSETKELSSFSISQNIQANDHLATSSNKYHLSAQAEPYEPDSKFHVTEVTDRSYRTEFDAAKAEEFPYTFPVTAPANNPSTAKSHNADATSTTSTVITSGAMPNVLGPSMNKSNRNIHENSSHGCHSYEYGNQSRQSRSGGKDYLSSSQGQFSGVHDAILHWQPSKDRRMHSAGLTPGTTLVSTCDELSDSDSFYPHSSEEQHQLVAYKNTVGNFRTGKYDSQNF